MNNIGVQLPSPVLGTDVVVMIGADVNNVLGADVPVIVGEQRGANVLGVDV